MPVVINDFEIVAERAPAGSETASPGATASPPAAASPVSPLEVERVLQYHLSRLARVAAD
jgi:hypothetical protein